MVCSIGWLLLLFSSLKDNSFIGFGGLLGLFDSCVCFDWFRFVLLSSAFLLMIT